MREKNYNLQHFINFCNALLVHTINKNSYYHNKGVTFNERNSIEVVLYNIKLQFFSNYQSDYSIAIFIQISIPQAL